MKLLNELKIHTETLNENRNIGYNEQGSFPGNFLIFQPPQP